MHFAEGAEKSIALISMAILGSSQLWLAALDPAYENETGSESRPIILNVSRAALMASMIDALRRALALLSTRKN